MTFKKGDQVRTDDGQVGEILFIDRGGDEAQVALARISIKLRTDTLEKVGDDDAKMAHSATAKTKVKAKPKVTKKRATPRR
jgi:hypothetical protein